MAVSPIEVKNLGQLRAVQQEAAARLNESPSMARLFLLDPVRALEGVGVTLSARCVDEWRQITGSLPSVPSEAFALLRDSKAEVNFTVKIHGILPPAGKGADDEVQS